MTFAVFPVAHVTSTAITLLVYASMPVSLDSLPTMLLGTVPDGAVTDTSRRASTTHALDTALLDTTDTACSVSINVPTTHFTTTITPLGLAYTAAPHTLTILPITLLSHVCSVAQTTPTLIPPPAPVSPLSTAPIPPLPTLFRAAVCCSAPRYPYSNPGPNVLPHAFYQYMRPRLHQWFFRLQPVQHLSRRVPLALLRSQLHQLLLLCLVLSGRPVYVGQRYHPYVSLLLSDRIIQR